MSPNCNAMRLSHLDACIVLRGNEPVGFTRTWEQASHLCASDPLLRWEFALNVKQLSGLSAMSSLPWEAR